MKTVAVIGKNFGDEGKGLVTASLCSFCVHPLVIKHNGGAQAGHTVENEEKGTRFVHHQIGSGAEYGADTLFAETFHPDLYQLGKEVEEFKSIFGFRPKLYAEAKTNITTIDDVLINMALETQRGDARHGSCGMGINECVERINAGFELSLENIVQSSYNYLESRLLRIREKYTVPRIKRLGIDENNPYYSLLFDTNVICNFASSILNNMSLIQIVDADRTWLSQYESLIFENGQGLLLDMDYLVNAPHLTTSKTGIAEPVAFLKKRTMELQEAVFVTRTYVTRHGAGPLPNEFERTKMPGIGIDVTNATNEWQGSIRYAAHASVEDFVAPIFDEIGSAGTKPSLAVTHLNETNNDMMFATGNLCFEDFVSVTGYYFENIYASYNHCDLIKIKDKMKGFL